MVTTPLPHNTPLYLMDAKRICIIKPSALGDVVQTLPLLPMLKARFPQATISWVINSGFANLLEDHPDLDEIIPFNRHGGWTAWPPLLRKLRSRKFDLVFDLQGLFRTAMMNWATGAPVRIGLETARELSHLACHQLVPETSREMPAHSRVWQVADALGMGAFQRKTTIPITGNDRDVVDSQLAALPGPFMAIQPGAQWVTKRWPIEKFADIAVQTIRQHDMGVVLIGSPGERSLTDQLADLIEQQSPTAPLLNLAGKTTLKQLAAVLERADLLLTNDSGPMHLAAELNVPLVGLFTSTSAMRSGPPPASTIRLVSTDDECAACYKKKCPRTGSDYLSCQQGLGVDKVWATVDQLLSQLSARAA